MYRSSSKKVKSLHKIIKFNVSIAELNAIFIKRALSFSDFLELPSAILAHILNDALSSTERLLQTFLLQENQPLSNRGLLPTFLIPAKLLIVQNKIVSYLLFMCGSANQHICKSALPKQYNAALVCFVVIKNHFAFDKIFYLRKDAFGIFRIDFRSGDIDFDRTAIHTFGIIAQ